MSQNIAASQTLSPPYGGFWRRFWALLLDSFIASIPPAVICIPLLMLPVAQIGAAPEGQEPSLRPFIMLLAVYVLWCVLSCICMWLYFALLESGKHQATWGKRLLGIKVVGCQGERISFARATGRYFSKILSYMICYIGFIMMPFTNRKRALHDMIAGTYVVKSSFTQGDPLPPTPRRIGWLIATIILLAAGYIGLIVLAIAADRQQAKTAARAAAAQLYAIHNDNENWPELPGTEDMDFWQEEDGTLYGLFYDESGDSYLLALPAGEHTVCCAGENELECNYIGLPPCT